MADKLSSPFHGDMKSTPSPKSGAPGEYDHNPYPDCVDKPADYSVLSVKFYERGPALGGATPAALSGPMGTAIPNVGHGFKGDK